MSPKRLSDDEIEILIEDWPEDLYEVVWELRDLVLRAAPEADETVAFSALCYSKPGAPYGRIGGNICLIGPRDDHLNLGFIHGAFLPDPDGLLRGKGKAARHVPLRSKRDIRRAAFRALIRAAVAHDPSL